MTKRGGSRRKHLTRRRRRHGGSAFNGIGNGSGAVLDAIKMNGGAGTTSIPPPPALGTSNTSATSTNTSGPSTAISPDAIKMQVEQAMNSIKQFAPAATPATTTASTPATTTASTPATTTASTPATTTASTPAKTTGGRRRRKRGGQWAEVLSTAALPASLLYMQNKYSKKRGFSRMMPKFGGKRRTRRRR
uniref:Uncharacterized protein n=1 Tax=viral metagenome TaxID=1070528 RepID=A0A6C0D8N7_9ZZZZ